jgi:hypothetical protein
MTNSSQRIVLSMSPDGTHSFFESDGTHIIHGIDVGAWLSTKAFRRGDNGERMVSVDELVCPVCLETVACGELMSVFQCGHALHFECAKSWLSSCIHQSRPGPCPLCNYIVIAPVFLCCPLAETVREIAGVSEEIVVDSAGGPLQVQAPAKTRGFRRLTSYLYHQWSLMRPRDALGATM